MGIDQSNKHGLRSDHEKRATTRHGFDPAPNASPVAGAYGKRGDGTEETAHRSEKAEREKEDES
jgi:hypothetical protein